MGDCLVIRNGTGIDTSDANALKSTIVSGYSCYVSDELINGSIPVRRVEQRSLHSGTTIIVTEGYYNNSIISTSTLEEETVSSAVSSDLLEGYSGWVNGNELTGRMLRYDTYTHSFAPNSSYTIPLGWTAPGSIVRQSVVTQEAVSVTPNTTDKLVCPANRWTSGSLTVAGDGNLATGNIKNGVVIFGIKGTFTGWVDPVSGSWDPCANWWRYNYGHGDSGGSYWYWYNNANASWKGWNYIYMSIYSNATYSNRVWTYNTVIWGSNSSPINSGSTLPTSDKVLLFQTFPVETWSANSPYTTKVSISSIQPTLDRWFSSGVIPFFTSGAMPNLSYFNTCNWRKIWFSLT